jgi:hypothetical protein
MRHAKERLVLASILLVGPLVYGFLILRPALLRIGAQRARRDAAQAEFTGPMTYAPLSAAERSQLADPAAPWRGRLTLVQGDQARLAHYSAVVTALQRTWRTGGTPALGIRSSWDNIHASFTLPVSLVTEDEGRAAPSDTPDLKVAGWVLEARFDPPTDRLFRALHLSAACRPLLEPVGLRWEFDPARGRSQHLLFRNLYLTP